MATQKAYSTVTLRRLPTGETVQITISSNMSMTILVNPDTGGETPDLATDNLIITPKVYGTGGVEAALSDVTWLMDGAAIPSTISTSIDSKTGALTIKSSPIGEGKLADTSVHPILISFSATATLNGHTYPVSKTVVLDCPEVSENSYWGSIEASNGTTLDNTITNTLLKPTLYLGTAEPTSYSVEWRKTGAGSGGADLVINDGETKDSEGNLMWVKSGNELTVYRDGVESAAHFEAHFKVSNQEVEAEGISIIDVADTLQIEVSGDTFISEGQTATLTLKVRNSTNGNQVNLTSSSVISVTASDSIRQRSYNSAYYTTAISTASGTGTLTMEEQYWRVPWGDNQAEGQWCICGDSEADDTMTTTLSEATKCEVNLLIGITL